MLKWRDDNLYYYNYKVFRGQFSYIIPIALLVLYNFDKKILNYFSYISLEIFIIGTYISLVEYKLYNLAGLIIFSAIGHLIFLYPLLNIKKYLKPNENQLYLLIIALLFVYFVPYWPYPVSRIIVFVLLIILDLMLKIIYEFI